MVCWLPLTLEAESFDDELFIEDSFAPFFCEDELWKNYLETDDEDEDFNELPEPEPEKREYFQDFMNNIIFYRYVGENTPATIEDTLKLT